MKTQQVLFISVLSFSFNLMYFFLLFISFHRVQNLKDTIERLHGIPATKQVLMISGGEVLNPLKRVSSYPSGTDENPIYMFSILFDSSKLLQPWPSESRKFPHHSIFLFNKFVFYYYFAMLFLFIWPDFLPIHFHFHFLCATCFTFLWDFCFEMSNVSSNIRLLLSHSLINFLI